MTTIYQPLYTDSYAVVVGINKYKHVPPLAHARKDAEEIAKKLTDKFQFPKTNVTLLVDEAATGDAIRSAFLRFRSAQPDDRVLFFFAGHGHTETGRHGEVGFLVPVNGKVDNLLSLIRWGELTEVAELIPAKHFFFVMDACYGGLFFTRRIVPSGSMRFLKDMLQRYSRQALTAGKANEPVADGGGIRPGHSIFTAHVLDALDGAVSGSDGIITAHRVMAYVYDKVANDAHSQQTPHYGFLDGDGDFVFDTSAINDLGKDDQEGKDILVPVSPTATEQVSEAETFSDSIKRLIADPRDRIRLDDFVSKFLRKSIEELGIDKFPASIDVTNEELAHRLRRYEDVVGDLETIVILIARWASENQLSLLEKIFARLAEVDKGGSGKVLWLRLGWYPVHFLMYAAGIAALSAEKFDVLRAVFLTRVRAEHKTTGIPDTPILVPVIDAMTDIHDEFKRLPGHERNFVPRSEYLFKALQPMLEDLLFLGRSYETYFDEFEVLLALVYADIKSREPGDIWGPPGRFAWKHSRGYGDGPFDHLVKQAQQQGAKWPVLQSGLFRGSPERFSEIAKEYRELIPKFRMR